MVSAAAAAAEQRQIVAVALRMIAGDQTEQRGFAGAVRADDLPMFTGVNLPVEMIEDRPIVIADHAVAQDDQRPIRRQRHLLRRILGLRQRQPAEVFAVRQLRHQRVRHHLAARPAAGQGAVRQHAHLPHKIRYFVEPVEHQHHGLTLGGKLAQQRGELRARVNVQPVEGLVEDQQVRLGHQRPAQQGFTRFAGGEVFEAARQQGGDAELRGQPLAARGVFHLFLNDFRRGAAGVVLVRAEQIGVVALPLVADHFLQLFEGDAHRVLKIAAAFTAQQNQFVGQRARQGGFAAAVGADEGPAVAGLDFQRVQRQGAGIA